MANSDMEALIEEFEIALSAAGDMDPMFLSGDDKEVREVFNEYFYTPLLPGHVYLNFHCLAGDISLKEFSYEIRHISQMFNYPEPNTDTYFTMEQGTLEEFDCSHLQNAHLSGKAFKLLRLITFLSDEGGALDGGACTSNIDSRSGYCGNMISEDSAKAVVQTLVRKFEGLISFPCECSVIAKSALGSISPNLT